jgi:hypothetical protein
MHVVNKKDGGTRITIDYRPLNNKTIQDALTVPYVRDLFAQLQDSKWFSKLDFCSGYFQIKMDPESKKYTAFSTEFGLFQFKVMPMGLTNSAATFQRFVQHVFADFLTDFVKVYIDDILVHSKTMEEHIKHVQLVITRIQEYGLKIKLAKCEFTVEEIQFLGHIISHNKIKPVKDKLKKLKNFERPKNIKKTQAFLGLAVYYKLFGKEFSEIAAPLYSMIGTRKFKWTNECETAFNKIKNLFNEESFLRIPDQINPLILDTDASGTGIGAVLSQLVNNEEYPIGCYSKHLTETEGRYPVTEKEFMVIAKAISFFKYYLYGKEFTVRTDHQPLKHLFTAPHLSDRIYRWYIDIGDYKFKIIYRKGKQHGNADAISRLTDESDENKQENEQNENTNTIICLKQQNLIGSKHTLAITLESTNNIDQTSDVNIQWIRNLILKFGDNKPTIQTNNEQQI